jgi:hypothetical protein
VNASDATADGTLRMGAAIVTHFLRTAFENVLLVDATFPKQHLAGYDGPIIQVFAPDFLPDPAELSFFRRFRQAGGHLPLFGFNNINAIDDVSREMNAAAIRELVLYIECEPNGWILEVMRRTSTVALLVRGASGTSCAAAMRSPGLLAIMLQENDLKERYDLVLPRERLDAIAERALEVFSTFPEVFEISRSSGSAGLGLEPHEAEIRLSLATSEPLIRTIPAGRFVHDGARNSEGDDRYSWIWVDRTRHLRVILGAIPVHKCTVRVVIAKAVDPDNLERPLLLHNGVRLATRCERWSDDCGAIISEILPAEDGINVLGIAFPTARALDDGGTLLSACIDRVEIAG